MTVVPIRLSRKHARKLDVLVKLGIYKNRTEAIKAMIETGSDERVSRHVLNENVLEALNQLLEFERKNKRSALEIVSTQAVADVVAEGRR